MRRKSKVQWRRQISCGIFTVVLVFALAFLTEGFAMVSRAQSAGKVTANSANVRKEADPGSEALAGVSKNEEITINCQVTGSDGMIWYQIVLEGSTVGYVRSDLVTITDGSTPPTQGGEGGASEGTASAAGNTNVTAVSPIEATIKGSDSVRVRSDASTKGNNIVTTVNRGQLVTVKGTATDADGKTWYEVIFPSGDSTATGFVRSDYVELSGELTAPEPEVPETPEPETPETPEPVPEPQKPYETALVNDTWYLYDYEAQKQYNIADFISANETYSKLYAEAQDKIKSQKRAIIIFVILLILLAAAAAFLAYKIKDMMDSAYFSQVEQETIRRRTADRPQRTGDQKVMHTVGGQSQQRQRPAQNGQRPMQGGQQPVQGVKRPAGERQQGQRPAGSQQQGQRPAGSQQQGQRPAGERQQGQRPAGDRPQGQRPAGDRPQGQRPAGERPQGQRPAGDRPQGQRPSGERPQGQRPAGSQQQGQRPSGGRQQSQRGQEGQAPGWKSRNFMEEDDEFEFEFLNKWDDEE